MGGEGTGIKTKEYRISRSYHGKMNKVHLYLTSKHLWTPGMRGTNQTILINIKKRLKYSIDKNVTFECHLNY